MTESEFGMGMNRLARVFGEKNYPEDRTKIIWREVNNLSGASWDRITQKLVGEHRFAPLIAEIREAASIERERTWEKQKRINQQEAAEFMSVFSREDVQMFCKTIQDRIHGRIQDTDWEPLVKSWKDAAGAHVRVICKRCSDGYVIWRDEDGYEVVARCSCALGDQKSNALVRA